MINLSYNLSAELEKNLLQIDSWRQKILLTPLSLRSELNLRWEATLSRIYNGLSHDKVLISKSEVARVLTGSQRKYSMPEKMVVRYKQALDYIYTNWLATNKAIKPQHIIELFDVISGSASKKKHDQFQKSKQLVEYFLDYLQRYPEKPVIQAAIAQIEMIDLKPFDDFVFEMGSLVSTMFLYKWGYDFRGFLSMEEYWHVRSLTFNELVAITSQKGRITDWLEFYTRGMCEQLEKVTKKTTELSFGPEEAKVFFKLNTRQREILKYLEAPYTKITNRHVQRLFSVSQITASRDLNGLVRLSLLFTYGKGRSVYYTRV